MGDVGGMVLSLDGLLKFRVGGNLWFIINGWVGVVNPHPGVTAQGPCPPVVVGPPPPGVAVSVGGLGGNLEVDFIVRGCGATLAASQQFDADMQTGCWPFQGRLFLQKDLDVLLLWFARGLLLLWSLEMLRWPWSKAFNERGW